MYLEHHILLTAKTHHELQTSLLNPSWSPLADEHAICSNVKMHSTAAARALNTHIFTQRYSRRMRNHICIWDDIQPDGGFPRHTYSESHIINHLHNNHFILLYLSLSLWLSLSQQIVHGWCVKCVNLLNAYYYHIICIASTTCVCVCGINEWIFDIRIVWSSVDRIKVIHVVMHDTTLRTVCINDMRWFSLRTLSCALSAIWEIR